MSEKTLEINIQVVKDSLNNGLNKQDIKRLEEIKTWIEEQKKQSLSENCDDIDDNLKTWLEEYDKVKNMSQEQLNGLESQLTGGNLGEIGISRSEALEFGKTELGITDPLNIKNFSIEVKKFQQANGLDIDGKIGAHTYMEMLTHNLNEKLDIALSTGKLSQEDQIKIFSRIEKASYGNTTTTAIMMGKIESFRRLNGEKEQYKGFFSKLQPAMNKANTDIVATPQGQEVINKPQGNGLTVAENLMKGNWREALKDPKTIGIAALLFIFGAFGSDTAATNTWWKRIAVLIGGKVLGVDKVFSKLLSEETGQVFSEGVSEGVDATKEYVSNVTMPAWIGDSWKKVTGFTSETATKVQESYKSVMLELFQTNESYKQSHPELYVKDIKEVSEAINADSAFGEKTIDELEKAKGDANAIRGLLSDSTKAKLFPNSLTDEQRRQREKDIVNYVNLLLSKKDNNDVFVRDLFVTKGIMDSIEQAKQKIMESNVGYMEHSEKANQDIRVILGSIRDGKVKGDLIYLLGNLGNVEPGNDRDNYNMLNNYLNEHTNLAQDIKNKIEQIRSIYLSEIVLQDAINEVTEINLANEKVEAETLNTIGDKITKLESIKSGLESDSRRLAGYDNSRFVYAYTQKRLELVEKGAKLEGATGGIYTNELATIKAEAEKLDQAKNLEVKQKEVEALEKAIGEVPAATASLEYVSAYLKDNLDNFKKAKDLLEDYKDATANTPEAELKTKLEAILVKSKILYEIIKAKKDEFEKKVNNLQSEVTNFQAGQDLTVDQYRIKKLELEELKGQYEDLKSKLEGGLLGQAKSYFTGIGNVYQNLEAKLKEIDESYALNGESLDATLGSINLLINNKELELKTSLNIQIDVTLPDNVSVFEVAGLEAISGYVNEIQRINNEIGTVIPGFIGDEIDEQNKENLEKQANKLVGLYIRAINNEDDLIQLAKIKSNFDTQVKDKLYSIVWFRSLIDHPNAVENAYNEKKVELRTKEILAKKISDSEVKDLQEIYMKAFQDEQGNNRDIQQVVEVASKFSRSNGDTTIGQIESILQVWSGDSIDWKDKNGAELINEKKQELNEIMSEVYSEFKNAIKEKATK